MSITFNLISSAIAQTAAPAATSTPESTLMGMLPIVLMFVVLYFVMIRPQMKRQKEQRKMLEALSKGDEIITLGGLLGKISKIGESYITIVISGEADKAVEVQVQRNAVQLVLPKGTLKSI